MALLGCNITRTIIHAAAVTTTRASGELTVELSYMNNYSLTYTGIIVMVAGTFLVNTLGFSEACSTEITSKGVEYAPLLIGAIMSGFGRFRMGGVKWYGARV